MIKKFKNFSKLQEIRVYLKDILALSLILLFSTIFYQAPPEINLEEKRSAFKNLSNQSQVKEKGLENEEKELYPDLPKNLFIFKTALIQKPKEEKITLPTFKEVLFGEKAGNIKLLAIMGNSKEKKAHLITHTGDLVTVKKGDKIDGVVVASISNKSVKFKWKNKVIELYLYKKKEKGAQPPKIQPLKSLPPEAQPSHLKPIPAEEEIVDEPEPFKHRPRRGMFK